MVKEPHAARARSDAGPRLRDDEATAQTTERESADLEIRDAFVLDQRHDATRGRPRGPERVDLRDELFTRFTSCRGHA
jgi:hypothetical protein